MMSLRRFLGILLFGFLQLSFAEDIPALTHPSEQLEKQREILQNLEKPKDQREKNKPLEIEKPPLLPRESEATCFTITKIQDEGITLLRTAEKEAIYREYLGKCNTLNDLSNLTRRVTALYMDKGYVTSKVYLKPQSIREGQVTLYALEGKIQEITPEARYIQYAFIGQKGDHLNLRDLESAIETINRLPSNHASMSLNPSERVGYTDIVVENNTTHPINGATGLNNFGSKTTGDKQLFLTLNGDNPFNLNDQFTINLNTTHHHQQDDNTRGYGYAYSIPLERFLATFSYNRSSYQQIIRGSINRYKSNGHSRTYALALNYRLFHSDRHRVSLGSAVSHYQTKNYLDWSFIETSSYNLSKLDTTIDYLYQTQGFYGYIAFAYTKGTDWFNNYNPTELDEKYSLYTLDLSLTKQLAMLQYSLMGHYQQTKDQLFGYNQIAIGGHYSIRGYQREGLAGNKGFYARHEISYPSPNLWFDYCHPSYFIALDHGAITKEEDTKGGKLLSNTLGIKLKRENSQTSSLETTLYYATPRLKKDVSSTHPFIGFSLLYRF